MILKVSKVEGRLFYLRNLSGKLLMVRWFGLQVCVSEDGRTLVIADTGHHRIIVADNTGQVQVLFVVFV